MTSCSYDIELKSKLKKTPEGMSGVSTVKTFRIII